MTRNTRPVLAIHGLVVHRDGTLILDQLDWREAHIYFRWRPFLRDPNDDLVLECALASGATHIVTFNGDHFREVSSFGIAVVTPGDFLHILPTP